MGSVQTHVLSSIYGSPIPHLWKSVNVSLTSYGNVSSFRAASAIAKGSLTKAFVARNPPVGLTRGGDLGHVFSHVLSTGSYQFALPRRWGMFSPRRPSLIVVPMVSITRSVDNNVSIFHMHLI